MPRLEYPGKIAKKTECFIKYLLCQKAFMQLFYDIDFPSNDQAVQALYLRLEFRRSIFEFTDPLLATFDKTLVIKTGP